MQRMTPLMIPSGNLTAYPDLSVERLHAGEPIIAPTAQWWEAGVTFNTAAVYLPRSEENDPRIARLLQTDQLDDPRLVNGVVAAHYRARPKRDPGHRWHRSFTGLAVFTPDTAHLLQRYDTPVISPDEDPAGFDALGVEDPRITKLGDTYYAVYCGVQEVPHGQHWKACNCLARSQDLMHWEKLGPVRGSISDRSNKDGVLFPETLDGQYLLLHRPMGEGISGRTISLAISDSLTGVWHDCGAILRATPNARCRSSWVGAGSVPIPLGDRRYLVIFHTGNYLCDGRMEYDLDAAIFNFQAFDPSRPSAVLEARIDRIMVPETPCEIHGPYPDSVANVLFTCGTYAYGDDLYILYGGGDTFVMSARVNTQALVSALATCRTGARTLLPV